MPDARRISARKPRIAPGTLSFTVYQFYRAPLARVWDAVTRDDLTPKYFVGKADGSITPELTPVRWWWKSIGWCPVTVTACRKHRYFEFHWRASSADYHTVVRFEFSRKKGRTVVVVTERGWKQKDTASAFDHCQGWSEMLYGAKAFVQHGMDLRK